jgi:hypothetical protein
MVIVVANKKEESVIVSIQSRQEGSETQDTVDDTLHVLLCITYESRLIVAFTGGYMRIESDRAVLWTSEKGLEGRGGSKRRRKGNHCRD